MCRATQLFTDYQADCRNIQGVLSFRKILLKGLIDHGLVFVTSHIRTFTELIENEP